MLAGDLFKWTDLSTWPWFVYLWIVATLAGSFKPAWRWFKRKRSAGWPDAAGYIESVAVSQPKATSFSGGRSMPYVAQLNYSYSTPEGRNAGWYRRDFATEEEAHEFLRDLKGKPVAVHYNPHKPSSSCVSEPSLSLLLQSRAPVLGAESYRSGDGVAGWSLPFLPGFIWIAAVGRLWPAYGCTLVPLWDTGWHPRHFSGFFTSEFSSFGCPRCLLRRELLGT